MADTITGWVLEFWDPDTHESSWYSSLDGNWNQAPDDNVAFLYVYLNDSRHVIRVKGTDHYFLTGTNVGSSFGGYNNTTNGEQSANFTGARFTITSGDMTKEDVPATDSRPSFLSPSHVKDGVYTPEPYASQIGLTVPGKTKPELRAYGG